MKVLLKNAIVKKILVVFITIIMISNFIMPNYVQAENGGKLFTPITELLLGITDRVMATLQAIFIGNLDWRDAIGSAEIKVEAPDESWRLGFGPWDGSVGNYVIRYSPAVIFSGKVPALDINFIEPMTEEEATFESPIYEYKVVADRISWADAKELYGAPDELRIEKGSSIWWVFTGNTDNYYSYWSYNGNSYYYIYNKDNRSLIAEIATLGLAHLTDEIIQAVVGEDNVIEGTLYTYNGTGTEEITKESTARVLQPQIARWYVALRTFALVGLLSVLLYIGIRIILSSNSSQNQAKYKAMLKDWLVALCILFVLHYVMAFVLDITGRITDIFEINTLDEFGRDVFMSDIRNAIVGEDDYWTYFGFVVIYIALAILTITFTIEYLKRVIFIAFLTMIAPLISLTYPIDKIKDGQAQAFGIWIKEYVFNCLIQPVHLLLYTIFIDSIQQIGSINPIYAIVALAFFRPAEKFFRKMFGFEKASSISTLGAAAGGAMVMNMLNKIQSKGPKGKESASAAGSGASNNQNGVRVATRNGGTAVSNVIGGSQPVDNQSGGSNSTGNSGVMNNQSKNSSMNNSSSNIPAPSRANGFKALGKKIIGPSALKSVGSWTMRNSIKAAGAIAGGTVGLAAGLADGDFELPIKNMAAGAMVGATGADNLRKSATASARTVNQAWKNASEVYQKGKLGDVAYNNMKFDEAFYKGDLYKQITQDSSIDQTNIKDRVQQYLDNGITGPEMIQGLKLGVSGDNFNLYSQHGISNANDMTKLDQAGITPEKVQYYRNAKIDDPRDMIALSNAGVEPNKYEEFENAGIKDINTISRIQKDPVLSKESPEVLRSKRIIANAAQNLGQDNDKETFRIFCRRYNITDDAEIDKFFDNLANYRLIL